MDRNTLKAIKHILDYANTPWGTRLQSLKIEWVTHKIKDWLAPGETINRREIVPNIEAIFQSTKEDAAQ